MNKQTADAFDEAAKVSEAAMLVLQVIEPFRELPTFRDLSWSEATKKIIALMQESPILIESIEERLKDNA